jgi:hypothetical protein
MSKKQENTSKTIQSETQEKRYGNLDKNKEFAFPKQWLDKDVVVVRQQKLVDVFGDGKLQAVDHPHPIQVYPKKLYDQMSIKPDGAKSTGFEDQGIKVTPLHDTSKPDEDIQYEVSPPAAETVVTEQIDLVKQAAEMAKEGETQTPAEKYTEETRKVAEEKATNIEAPKEEEAKKEGKGK